MDIYPQDLGPKAGARIIQIRAAFDGSSLGSLPNILNTLSDSPVPPDALQIPLSLLAAKRLALKGSLLPGLTTSGIILALGVIFTDGGLIAPQHWHLWPLGSLAGALAVGGLSFSHSLSKYKSRLHRKITWNEMVMLTGKKVPDVLTKEYYQIVNTLRSLPTPTDTLAEQSIRQTLHRLGEAVESLPPPPAESAMADLGTLQKEAARLTAQARDEQDAVIVASMERQAQALTLRAETIARTTAFLRRNQALRDEVEAQVKAFQTSLDAAQINGNADSNDFAGLAASVAQVAQEVTALVDARAELDAASPPASVAPEAALLGLTHSRR